MKPRHLLLPAIGLAAAPAAFAATPAAHTATTITDGGLVSDDADPYSGHLIYRFTGRSTVAITGVTGIHDLMWDSTIGMTINLPRTVTIAGNEYTVDTIDPAALANQDTIEHIVIPATITKIYPTAFANCPNLKSLEIFADTPPSIEKKTIHKGITVSVKESAVKAYKKHPIWGTCNIVSGMTAYDFIVPDIVDTPSSTYEQHRDDEEIVIGAAQGQLIGAITFPGSRDGEVMLCPGPQNVHYTMTGTTTCAVDKSPDAKISVAIPSTFTINDKEYTVTAIGDGAFWGCDALTSVNLPNSVTTIGDYAFFGCEALTSIDIPSSVTTIGDHAFCSCDALTAINIPNSVTTIGEEAFIGCESLISINIPSSVTNIGNGAFYGCDALTSIDIPEGVTTIGDCAFSDCKALTNINVANDNPTYCSVDGALFSKDQKTLIRCPGAQQDTYCIPNTVTTIGGEAFSGCESLTSINIPNSVTTIGDWAFWGCDALTSIDIPNSVTTIGDYAFSGCKALTSINIPSSVTTIGDYAFFDCDALTSINCRAQTPPTLKENPYYQFYFPSAVVTIHVPKGCAEAYRADKHWKDRTIVDDL